MSCGASLPEGLGCRQIQGVFVGCFISHDESGGADARSKNFMQFG